MPEKHDVRIILTGTKLSSQFDIKDNTNKQHKYDLVYFSRCPFTNCTDSYIGDTARRLSEGVMDHGSIMDGSLWIMLQRHKVAYC